MNSAAAPDRRGAFAAHPGFLNTATVGIPPASAVEAMQSALTDWRSGRLVPTDFDAFVERARTAWARIAGVAAADVAVGPAVSYFVGLVAASIPDGARILVAEGDFTSVLFPFLVQQHRGITVRQVPLAELVPSVDERVDLVAVSAVQSSDGVVLDVPALVAAAAEHGARIVLDVTQALGWLPLDLREVDYVVCAGYKWLLSPRGTAFLAVRRDRSADLVPNAAGWYAGEQPWSSIYGLPLRLATTARRFDVSPDWFAWVGAAHALELLAEVDADEIHRHDLRLANEFLTGLDRAPSDSAIVTVDVPGADALLAQAGVTTAVRGGRVRASFHLYTDEQDVAIAVAALRATVR